MGGCGCGKKKKIISLFASGRPLRRNMSNISGMNQIANNSKNSATTAITNTDSDIEYVTDISPTDWGPLLWKLFHIMAERIGNSGVESLDRDEATAMELIIDKIPDILPCVECQGHAKTYIRTHPIGNLKNLRGNNLKNNVRNFFWQFHNTVRTNTGKDLIVNTVEDCRVLYEKMEWLKCDMEQVVEYFSFGVHHGIVKSDAYKRWMTQVHKLRLIAGF